MKQIETLKLEAYKESKQTISTECFSVGGGFPIGSLEGAIHIDDNNSLWRCKGKSWWTFISRYKRVTCNHINLNEWILTYETE